MSMFQKLIIATALFATSGAAIAAQPSGPGGVSRDTANALMIFQQLSPDQQQQLLPLLALRMNKMTPYEDKGGHVRVEQVDALPNLTLSTRLSLLPTFDDKSVDDASLKESLPTLMNVFACTNLDVRAVMNAGLRMNFEVRRASGTPLGQFMVQQSNCAALDANESAALK